VNDPSGPITGPAHCRRAALQEADHPAAAGALAGIAQLQQRVQAWLDGDRLFPADGRSLLAALDRVQAGLAGEDAPGARAGIAAFVGQVQALVEARVLAVQDGHPLIEVAAALAVSIGKERGNL
jgi:hypothetical protein